jgi:hypothetical protein
MTEQGSTPSRHARATQNAGRALLLAGLGTGLWLLGSSGSAAEAHELPPIPVVEGVLATVDQQVVDPVVHRVVEPTVSAVVLPVVTDVAVPVVEQVAVPVVENVVAPVVETVVDPVVQDVVTPVVEDVVPVEVVEVPVTEAPEPAMLEPVAPTLVDIPAPAATTPVVVSALAEQAHLPTAATAAERSRAVLPVPSGVTAEQVSLAAPTTPAPVPVLPGGPAGVSGTVPASSTSSGSGSADQTPADLASAAPSVALADPRTTRGSDPALLGTGPFDPSFSPD